MGKTARRCPHDSPHPPFAAAGKGFPQSSRPGLQDTAGEGHEQGALKLQAGFFSLNVSEQKFIWLSLNDEVNRQQLFGTMEFQGNLVLTSHPHGQNSRLTHVAPHVSERRSPLMQQATVATSPRLAGNLKQLPQLSRLIDGAAALQGRCEQGLWRQEESLSNEGAEGSPSYPQGTVQKQQHSYKALWRLSAQTGPTAEDLQKKNLRGKFANSTARHFCSQGIFPR